MLRPAMGKAMREKKKARKADKAIAEAEQLELERKHKRRLALVVAVPVLSGLAAAAAAWGYDRPSLAGAILLGGALVWLAVGLSFIGAQVPRRNRGRAGSIDFGR